MTDAQYLAWLLADNPRIILAELTYYTGTPGVTATEYVSTTAYAGVMTGGGPTVSYQPLIAGVPDLAQSIDAPLAAGTLDLHNESGALDSWLNRSFDGRPITLRIGGPGWAGTDFRPLITGIIDHVDATRDRLQVVFRDAREKLNKPLITDKVNDDDLVPILLAGRNVEPVLQDSATRTYRVTKGPMQNVTEVRANGTSVTFTQNLTNGTVTLTTSATGQITVDAIGESGAYDSTTLGTSVTKSMVWLGKLAGLVDADFDATSLAALKTKLAPAGFPYNDHTYGWWRARTNVIDAIESILAPRGCYWDATRDGKIRAWRLDLPTGTPALTLGPYNIVEKSLVPVAWEPPIYNYLIGPVPNYTLQDPAGLDAALSDGVRAQWGRENLDKADNYTQFFPGTTYAGAIVRGWEVWPMTRDTLIGEVSRRAAIHNVPRRRYRLRVIAPTLPVSLGDEVRITDPRFGFASGANAIVVGMRESFARGVTELEVWK